MNKTCTALLIALTAGCQLAPEHQRPDQPTAALYPKVYAPERGEAAASDIAWQVFFTDPRLRHLVSTALQHNRDLRVAIERIEEARGLYRVQGASRYPTLGLNAEATRGRFPTGAGTGGATPPTAPGAAAGAGGGIVERYSLGLGVSAFELDFWGRVRNLTEAARAQYLGTLEAQRAFRLSLIADVASTYLALLEAEERIRLAEATVESRRDGLRIARVRLDAGITSALDWNQARALLTQAETELAGLRLTQAQQRNFLVQLVGTEIERTLPDPLPLTQQISETTLRAGLPSDLLYVRPDIIAAEESLRAARANIGVARAAFFPQISLTGTFGYASNELDGLVNSDNETWSIGPTISLPLFDFGRNRGNLTVAQARENIAVAEYEDAIQTAFREVSDALAGRQFLAEQLIAQEENVEVLREIAELAQDRYAEGVVNYLQVLDASRNLFQAEQAYVQIKRAQVQNLIELYVALGGGTTAPRQLPE
ncbi:efflux transporter outer membrane subunit [Pseudomonas sp. gcc21]|uniref:efflux transporter outer membrane subunit n=1 Tax=Pseudomonas sp. gcc21 TaxID=2726989 RepID=UPI0014520AD4|nr:efflux transporter outer membrane subunit [Pseudomonas sp. gcc21]QJD58370.1 efflux transporter outer membrane subunit [Pseudomonas sp. gcc21]